MKRSGIAPSTKPMKRTSMKKGSRPKMTPIRASARDEECTLRFPGICNYRTDTTVWAHSNSHLDGKGMGIKAKDQEGCYACGPCHLWIDGGYVGKSTREIVDGFFDLARVKSQKILKAKGLLK